MKFFVDSADVNEIRELAATGLVDGVTTNPTLIAKAGRPIKEVIAEICAIVPGAGVGRGHRHRLRRHDARRRRRSPPSPRTSPIKVPLTWDGLRACRTLSDKGHMVNVTLCFSANQALLAAKAGATFISPFIGRLDDIGFDGMELIREIRTDLRQLPGLQDRDPRRLDAHAPPRQAGGDDRRRRRDHAGGADQEPDQAPADRQAASPPSSPTGRRRG